MTNRKKELTATERIEFEPIFGMLDKLENQLEDYIKFNAPRDQIYLIRKEIDGINRSAQELENRIKILLEIIEE